MVPVAEGALQQDVWAEQDFVAAVLAHPLLAFPTAAAPVNATQAQAEAAGGGVMHVFASCNGSRNIVWAQWLQPGETIRAALKYRVLWPEGKRDLQRTTHTHTHSHSVY